MPLSNNLVVCFARARVSLIVVDGVAGQAVSFAVKLHRAVGDV